MTASGSAAGLRRTARIDLEAFGANISRAISAHGDVVLDARANAYGHGLLALAPVALELGITTIRISPAQEPELRGFKRSRFMTVHSVRPTVAADAYGLSGANTAVMTLSGEVVAVKPVPADVGVSYGYSYRTASDTTLALVGLGYADGVPRLASNRTTVVIAGTGHPLVGRVAMDQFVVDCGDNAPAVGDEAILFGDAAAGLPTAADWAVQTERSALELTAGLASRIRREYV